METKQAYFTLTPAQIGHLGAVKRVLDNLTRFSIAGGGISALSPILGGGKIELLLPLFAGLIGFLATTLRDVVSYYIEVSEPKPTK